MSIFDPHSIITAIDIGTTKISVVIGQINHSGEITIKGFGKSPCNGLKKGIIVDSAKTVDAINKAVHDAESSCNITIEKAIIGISGSHITGYNSSGVEQIKNGIISQKDIANVLAAAQAIALPDDQQIIHVLPRYFTIDNKEIVHEPINLHGTRLEVEAHIITGAISAIKNLVNCCEQANIEVLDIILEQIASAHAVLSPDERILGVLVIDIGGGTSDIALYYNNALHYTKVIPIAGNHFTNDLAIGLRTTHKTAEHIKKKYGIVHQSLLDKSSIIEIEQVQEHDQQTVTQSELYDILMPRAVELLKIIKKELQHNHLEKYIQTGIVLTGGGSLLSGIKYLAEDIFKLPIRIGNPHINFIIPEEISSPIFSTSYGMLIYAGQSKKNSRHNNPLTLVFHPTQIFERVKTWITDLF